MSHRFIYTDSNGREVRLESQADLHRAVTDGRVTPDTLLFDELTSEWAPARSHPLVRLAIEELVGPIAEEAETDPQEPVEDESTTIGVDPTAEDDAGADEPDVDVGLDGLTLAELPLDLEEDDTVEDFRERLERERRQALELETGTMDGGLEMVRGDTVADIAQPGAETPEPAAEPAPPAASTPSPPASPPAAPPVDRETSLGNAPAVDRALPWFPSAADSWEETEASTAAPVRPGGFDREGLRQVALMAALLGVGFWGIVDARAAASAETGTVEVLMLEAAQGSEPPPQGLLEVRASTDGAFADMRDGMERIRVRMGIEEPPTVWLSGEYLADPDVAPEVRDFWLRYAGLPDSLRLVEEELFRSGFVTRLQQRGIIGPVLSIRLARALGDFRADRPRREVVYSAMEGLAAEALSLDNWLRMVSGRIAYAGVRDGAVSMAPELEAAPLDEATRVELDRRLNRLLDALDRVTGSDPTEARNLTGHALGDLMGTASGG